MVAAVEFKRCVAGIGIYGIAVCKFSLWQEACPVILFLVYKGSEVCLYCAVLPFGLVISLRTESPKVFFLFLKNSIVRTRISM